MFDGEIIDLSDHIDSELSDIVEETSEAITPIPSFSNPLEDNEIQETIISQAIDQQQLEIIQKNSQTNPSPSSLSQPSEKPQNSATPLQSKPLVRGRPRIIEDEADLDF